VLVALGLLVVVALLRGAVAADTGHISEAIVLLALGGPFVFIGLRNLGKDS
jgi:hypothetical protein